MRRWLVRGFVIVIVGFLAIQLVPYGRSHTNPPVTAQPAWDSPQTRALAVRACFDCHSNETAWPWYTNIAPISWRTQQHVDEGRSKLNFSTWGTGRQEIDKINGQITSGAMPPLDYLLLHPEARLSDQEKAQRIAGLQPTQRGG